MWYDLGDQYEITTGNSPLLKKEKDTNFMHFDTCSTITKNTML